VKQVYRFLGYDLDPVHRVIARDGDLLPMPPKVVDTLLVLVERAGEVVDKDTLIHSVWPDTSVVESSLTRNISLLRKTLAQDGSSEVVIQTVSKRGYRFLPTVEIVQQLGEPADLNARPEPAAGVPTQSTVAARRIRAFGLGAGALALAAVAVALVVTGTFPTSRRSEVLTDADREYLVGRHLWHKVEPVQVERALHRFHKAAELDPRSALAHAGIADSHVLMIHLAMTNRAHSLKEARAAAHRAIALDPYLALPRVSLGYVAAMSDLDLRSARREFERGVELGFAGTHPGYGDYLTWVGDLDGARRYFQAAKEIDPVSAIIGTRAARLEYFAQRYAHAIDLLKEVLEREPSFPTARYYLALSYAFLGHIDAALLELRHTRLNPDVLATDEAWIRSVGGDSRSARALIDARQKEVEAGTRKWTELLIPAISVADDDLAIRALEEMWKTREIELLHLKVDPRFDRLRSDERFGNLTTRVFGGATVR
jgi:DNA-binding winged helix-turn-helix (wHTH) protein/tetratricopeptide (TPR) repeat protein